MIGELFTGCDVLFYLEKLYYRDHLRPGREAGAQGLSPGKGTGRA